MSDWKPGEMHRCKECIRPICQRPLNGGQYNGQVSLSEINEYGMYGQGGNA